MKRIVYITAILTGLLFILTPFKTKAQCKQQMVYACATKGKSIYLRDFNTKLRSGRPHETSARWTIVLNKDAHYRFNLCTLEGYEDKVIMTLYDSQHPERTNPLGSTYDPKTGKFTDSFDFICRKSGMYYVSIRLRDGVKVKKTCAVGILSFVGSAH